MSISHNANMQIQQNDRNYQCYFTDAVPNGEFDEIVSYVSNDSDDSSLEIVNQTNESRLGGTDITPTRYQADEYDQRGSTTLSDTEYKRTNQFL